MVNCTHRRKSPRIPDRDYSAPDCYMVTINAHRRDWLFGDVVGGEMQLSDFGTIVREEWLRTAALRPCIVIDAFIVMPNHFHAIIALIDAFLRGRGAPRPYDRDWIAYRLFRAAHHPTAASFPGADRCPSADPRFPSDRMGGACPAPDPRLPTTDQCPALEKSLPIAEQGTGGACPALEERPPLADPSRFEEIEAYLQGTHTPDDRDRNPTLSDVVGAFKSAATRRINALRGTRGMTSWQRSFHDHAIRDALDLELHRNYIDANPRRWAKRYG
ncbi:MAG TPA: hypothetical protein VHO25_03260 [Polyangiaceae bacterium]|nr:hypothetical protein [Polyangiaceae bacterium]